MASATSSRTIVGSPAALPSDASLELLLEASAVINSSLDLQTTLHAIAQSAAQVLRAEASSVLLLDPRRKKLIFKAAWGDVGGLLVGQEFDASLGIAGRVALAGTPELVRDVQRDPAFYGGFDQRSTFKTRTILAAPLRHREQTVGVVEVLNRRSGLPDFNERDLELLQIFANLAAISVSNAQMHQELIRENRGLLESVRSDDHIVAASAAMKIVTELCERVAQTKSTVLLLGETGTGKEVHAKWIHQRSLRAMRPFIGVNCAALPETLLESELFGHEAGAFTGAMSRKQGRFELADGGTLFLDEIGDISMSTQIKLLRVLQEREFVRVGGTKTIACDVRIIAATNRDLRRAISSGQFREDLFYRLNVFPISLPALRDRREDIPALVDYFVETTARQIGVPPVQMKSDALEMLCAYRWPGNIRELRNVIERAVLLAEAGTVGPAQLPPEVQGGFAPPEPALGQNGLESYEKAMIIKTLRENDWNQTRAAAALNMTRDNLRYRLKKYQIARPAGES